MKYFKIIFDNTSESYFAGQIVSGKIHLHLSQPKRIKALKLKLIGKGEAHWSKQKGKRTKYYDAEEFYLNHEKILIEEASEDTTIPAGNHIYDFHYRLPVGIPSSFQAKKAWVQYYAVATITRTWSFSKKTSSYFTVNGLVDLNTHLTASNSVGLNKTERLSLWGCCGSYWCCTNSTVGFVLNLDKTGFVPGEKIPFALVAFNQSEHRVKAIKASIIQVATFHVRYHERFDTATVKELVGPGLEPGGSTNWEPRPGDFRVPAVPPTNLGGGTIITLEYFLQISLKVQTLCDSKVVARIPIIIGTIPFRNTFEQFIPSSRFQQNLRPSAEPAAPTTSTQDVGNDGLPSYGTLAIPLSLDGYPDLPPPTYNEAMELFDKYGSVPPLSVPATFDQVDNVPEDDVSDAGEMDEAGAGRPYFPRYATYGWARL